MFLSRLCNFLWVEQAIFVPEIKVTDRDCTLQYFTARMNAAAPRDMYYLVSHGIQVSIMYCVLLPPTIRRMGEGNIFSLFTLAGGGGYPISSLRWGEVPQPGLDNGMGYPPRHGMGYPPRHGMGYPPRPRMGYPPGPGMGYPPRPGMGYPPWTWDGVPPRHGTGYPPDMGQGTPPDMGQGTPPDLRWGTPPRQISIVSTCYAAGGMPLAFTQEDFLVSKYSNSINPWVTAIYLFCLRKAFRGDNRWLRKLMTKRS